MSDKPNKTLAAAKVKRVKTALEAPEHASDPNLDNHRDLVASAECLTNGSAGDIEAVSATLGLFVATYTQDRLREPARLKETFGEMHDAICPVVRNTQVVDGKPVYPWEQAKDTGSFLSFNFKEGLKSRGAASTVAAVVVTVVLAFWALNKWQDSKTRSAVESMFDRKIEAMAAETTAKGG